MHTTGQAGGERLPGDERVRLAHDRRQHEHVVGGEHRAELVGRERVEHVDGQAVDRAPGLLEVLLRPRRR